MTEIYAGKSPMERGDHDVEHESELLTIKELSEELRMYAGRPEGIHVDPSAFAVWADAIDAHLAKAAQGEAVAEVRHFNYSGIARNGFSQEVVLLDSVPTMPEGTKLYAAPRIAEPAQPVETLDEHTSFEDSCRARGLSFTRNEGKGDDYSGPHIQAMWDGWCDRAALAHPRPTGDSWTCFQCSETFTDRVEAALHFGTHQSQHPACAIDVAAYRAMEAKEARYFDEDADIHRQMHRMANDHQLALRRAEEAGYAKALKDTGYTAPTGEQAAELDRTAPERIYLQVDGDGDNADRDEAFPNFADYEVTWCAQSQGGLEVEYVRADLAKPRPVGEHNDAHVATVYTMEALVPGGRPVPHAEFHCVLPAGTKLYISAAPNGEVG